MRIVATADLHGAFPKIPECDLLLIAGDVCPVDESHEIIHQRNWLRTKFVDWLKGLDTDRVVWIAGNHDFACEGPGFPRVAQEISDDVRAKDGPYVEYLKDSHTEVEGLEIYGSPWVPNLQGWAFYAEDSTFRILADDIPGATDILLLHGPPKGILDSTPTWGGVGAPNIAARIQQILPKLVIFGHIHEAYGTEKIGEVEFANVAHMDEYYHPVNPPVVFELLGD